MKILVICTRRLGDVFLATPTLHALRLRYPNAQLDMLVFRGTEMGVLAIQEVDNVITISERTRLKNHLKFFAKYYRHYDISISLLPGDRPVLYAWLFGKKRYGTLVENRKYFWKKWLLTKYVVFDSLGRHTLVMYHDIAAQFLGRFEIAPQIPSFFKNDKIEIEVFQRWQYKKRYVVMHLTPKFRYKEWPISSWRQLIKACLDNHLGVVLIGMFDGHPPEATGQLYLKDEKVLNLLNQTSFNDLTKLICAAGCYVGTDTAVTHIAAATGTPTIALFGPSNPLVWGPWPSGYSGVPSAWTQVGTQRVDNVTLVQGSGWCVPCMNEGCSQHISSVSECLDNLNPNKVISATLRCFH